MSRTAQTAPVARKSTKTAEPIKQTRKTREVAQPVRVARKAKIEEPVRVARKTREVAQPTRIARKQVVEKPTRVARKQVVEAKPTRVARKSHVEIDAPRAGSKLSDCVELLSRAKAKGVTRQEIADYVGWTLHTIHGVLTALKHRGYNVIKIGERAEGGNGSYRIVA